MINQNLYDSKFRSDDGIHLTPHGTSVFATNLKHTIAKALNISVIKKEENHVEIIQITVEIIPVVTSLGMVILMIEVHPNIIYTTFTSFRLCLLYISVGM